MTNLIQLDPSSPVALYLQISEQVRRWVVLGALRPGDRLPTVRELAARTRVNRNTAARAIQQLETEGIVRTRVLDAAIDRLLVDAHTVGVSLDELGGRLAKRIERFNREQEARGERGDDA